VGKGVKLYLDTTTSSSKAGHMKIREHRRVCLGGSSSEKISQDWKAGIEKMSPGSESGEGGQAWEKLGHRAYRELRWGENGCKKSGECIVYQEN